MKVIITGSTGMVGKGVLLECLDDERIKEVVVINRNPIQMVHDKLKEIIHKDFTDFSPIKDLLKGYDACYHCMGVSSAGMSEEKFHKLTYTVTESLAKNLIDNNPNMVFNYVSGQGTDSSEKGRVMWARVKGKAENLILNLGFKDAYAFRPGAIIPEKGVKSSTGWYNLFYVIFRPLFPILRTIKSVTTSIKIGKAMINTLFKPQALKHLEGADINTLASL